MRNGNGHAISLAEAAALRLEFGAGAVEPEELETALRPKVKTPPTEHRLVYPSELRFDPTVRDPLKDVIGPRDVGFIFGPSRVGKTFVVVDLAMAIAGGVSHWCGRRVRGGAVLYGAFEGARGLQKRLIAARAKRGDVGKRLAFAELTVPLNKQGGMIGADMVLTLAERLAKESDCPVKLIVIDTLSAAAAGDDENAASDMSAFVTKLKSIAARTGASVACIHHTGKEASRGMRGSAALLGNADFVLEIGENNSVSIAKSREGKTGVLSNFALEQVELGTDEDGDVATSCVVRFTQASAEAKRRKAPLPANPKRALDLLHRFYSEDKAQEVDPSLIGLDDISPDKRPLVVPIEAWKELCASARLVPDGKPSSERQTFDRAVNALDAANEIGRFGAYVWVLGQKRNVPK